MEKTTCVMALGYFDSVHIGHKKVIAEARAVAEKLGVKTGVFTFGGDLAARFHKTGGMVFTLAEREKLLAAAGADFVYAAACDEAFLSLDKSEFLAFLLKKFDVRAFVCGFDYTFGKGGAGDAAFLRDFAEEKNIAVKIVPEMRSEGVKVSTTEIKKRLAAGDVEGANALLGNPYFVTGSVVKERGVGHKIGFPTVNLYPAAEKFPLKNAVYGGHAYVNGVRYLAIVNYGARPTFGLSAPLTEAHLIGFDGDLYGEQIAVYFDFFLRKIKKFNGVDELKKQLETDTQRTKEHDKIRTER